MTNIEKTDGGTQTEPELHIVLECKTDPASPATSPAEKPLSAEMLRCDTIQDLNERGISTKRVIEVLVEVFALGWKTLCPVIQTTIVAQEFGSRA